MRRFLPWVVLVAALIPAAAVAQGAGDRPSLGFSVGYWGPFGSDWDGGFTARFNAELPYQGPLGFRFTAGAADLARGSGPVTRSADLAFATAGAIYQLPTRPVETFVHGGVGVYRVGGGRTSTEVGLSAGAGMELPLAMKGVSLIPELTAHAVTGNGPSLSVMLTMGLRFGLP